MRYTYTKYTYNGPLESPTRGDVFSSLDSISEADVTPPCYIEVYDLLKDVFVSNLMTPDSLESWRIGQERAHVWQPFDPKETEIVMKSSTHNDAINPKHYSTYMEGYQWIDTMSRIQRFKDPEVFKGAVELQVRKYLDRNGHKDEELQELQKALWYLKYLVAFIKNGD